MNSESRSFVRVNYGLSIEQMIINGRYNYTDPFIKLMSLSTERKGESYVLIELIQFDRAMKSREVAKELQRRGFRPATLPELLAYGAAHPEQQKVAPIVALGSIWRDALSLENVAFLWYCLGKRLLDLACLADPWPPRYRFAAIRIVDTWITANF